MEKSGGEGLVFRAVTGLRMIRLGRGVICSDVAVGDLGDEAARRIVLTEN